MVKFCEFGVRGVRGYGICEWLYPNKQGRSYPISEAIFDPCDIVEFYDNSGSCPEFNPSRVCGARKSFDIPERKPRIR